MEAFRCACACARETAPARSDCAAALDASTAKAVTTVNDADLVTLTSTSVRPRCLRNLVSTKGLSEETESRVANRSIRLNVTLRAIHPGLRLRCTQSSSDSRWCIDRARHTSACDCDQNYPGYSGPDTRSRQR